MRWWWLDFLSFTTGREHQRTKASPNQLEVHQLPSAALNLCQNKISCPQTVYLGFCDLSRNLPSPGSNLKPNKRATKSAFCSCAPGVCFDLSIAFVFVDACTLLQKWSKETFQDNLQGSRHVHRHNHQHRRTKGYVHSYCQNYSSLHYRKDSSKQLLFRKGFSRTKMLSWACT